MNCLLADNSHELSSLILLLKENQIFEMSLSAYELGGPLWVNSRFVKENDKKKNIMPGIISS